MLGRPGNRRVIDELEDDLGCAFGHLEALMPVGDEGVAALADRVKGCEVDHLGRGPAGRRRGRQDGEVNGVTIVCPTGERRSRDDLARLDSPTLVKGSPTARRFWVRVPVLSAHNTSTPPSSSTAAR